MKISVVDHNGNLIEPDEEKKLRIVCDRSEYITREIRGVEPCKKCGHPQHERQKCVFGDNSELIPTEGWHCVNCEER